MLSLCIFTSLPVFLFAVAGAEEASTAKPPVNESSAEEQSTEEVTLEDLKPEPLGDLFAIKLLEKIIELEDALKYLAKEVGEMNERLTKEVSEMKERLTKLETAPPPPAYAPASSGPYTPPPPPQKRFEVGDVYLGSGFKARDIVYETTEKGTTFTGKIENNSSAEVEKAEFEIIVYDEEDKMIGFTTFWLNDIGFGASQPFEVVVKGPKAHWIKRYEIRHLRSS